MQIKKADEIFARKVYKTIFKDLCFSITTKISLISY